MAVNRNSRLSIAYGLDNALQTLAPEPIVSVRNPTANDTAPISTIWVNSSTNAYYVLTSVSAGAANWQAQATGSGTFAQVEVTGGAGTVLTVDAGGDTDLGGDLSVAGNASLTGDLNIIGNTNVGTIVTINTPVGTPVALTQGASISGVYVISGAGSPSGTVTAPQGSLYLNTTGSSSSTRAYINTDGAMTWTAITTAS